MQPEMLVLKPSEMCESGSRTCKKVQIEVDRSQDQFFLVERSGHESTVEMGNPLQMEVFMGTYFILLCLIIICTSIFYGNAYVNKYIIYVCFSIATFDYHWVIVHETS